MTLHYLQTVLQIKHVKMQLYTRRYDSYQMAVTKRRNGVLKSKLYHSLAFYTKHGRFLTTAFTFTERLIIESIMVTIPTNRFNIQQFYVLPIQCIYVFSVDLRTNSDYFPIQH